MQLNDRALLVQLTISTWTARKHDKKATRDTTVANNAADTAGRFNKHLLPQSDALKNVQQKAGQIRAYFYENTLPWGIDGVQLLPSKNYLNFVTEMRRLKGEFQYLVSMFLLGYPDQVRAAQQFLGGMYDAADYPHEDDIAGKFNIDMAAYPVPTDDFRVNIDDDEMAQIQEDVRRRVMESQKKAMQDVWQRLYSRLQTTYEKLVQPDAVFRDSLIENIHELCELLPRLNVDDDPNLEAMRQEVLTKVAAFSPDALRADKQVRSDTASAAKAIMDTMSALYMND
jgi:hypothetical protein